MTFLTETWIVFARAMRLSLRNPTWVIIGLSQPILYLVLFGPLLKPLAPALGAVNAWQLSSSPGCWCSWACSGRCSSGSSSSPGTAPG